MTWMDFELLREVLALLDALDAVDLANEETRAAEAAVDEAAEDLAEATAKSEELAGEIADLEAEIDAITAGVQ